MVPPAPASRPQISVPPPAGDRDCQLTVEADLHSCCDPFDPPSRTAPSFGDGDIDTGKPVALRCETDSRARAIRQLRQAAFGTQEALLRQEGTRTQIQRLGHKRMPRTFETFDPDGINARFSHLIPRPQCGWEIVLDESTGRKNFPGIAIPGIARNGLLGQCRRVLPPALGKANGRQLSDRPCRIRTARSHLTEDRVGLRES